MRNLSFRTPTSIFVTKELYNLGLLPSHQRGGPISGKSRRQDNVSLSTSEAEFVAASQAGQEAIYLRETLTDFGFFQTKATLLYEDNLACVAMSENPVRRKFSLHTCIDIRKSRYYVRELVLNGFLKLVPLRTHKMVADALTKSLPSPAFVGHRQIMTCHASFSSTTLRRRLILSADFERCVFPIFSLDCQYFFSPSALHLGVTVLSCV